MLRIDCGLKKCLNYEKGQCCNIVPTIVKACRPNDKSCPYYDDDFSSTYFEIKSQGGIGALVRRSIEEESRKRVNKLEVKRKWAHRGYTIERLASRSYRVFNSDGRKVHAKPVMLDMLLELDESLDRDVWKKKGTRPIGNNLIRLLNPLNPLN